VGVDVWLLLVLQPCFALVGYGVVSEQALVLLCSLHVGAGFQWCCALRGCDLGCLFERVHRDRACSFGKPATPFDGACRGTAEGPSSLHSCACAAAIMQHHAHLHTPCLACSDHGDAAAHLQPAERDSARGGDAGGGIAVVRAGQAVH